jgi:hypothetical protein
MKPGHIFISHASKDDDFVKELRDALEGHQLTVWVDSRNLRSGDKLAPEISTAIEQARQVIVVVSPDALHSEWVQREVKQALEVEARRKGDGYRVIPLFSAELQPAALRRLFGEEPVGLRAANEAASLLLSLPWELLHDGRGFLFHGKNPVRVRRRLPNRHPQETKPRALPIRILLGQPAPRIPVGRRPRDKREKGSAGRLH